MWTLLGLPYFAQIGLDDSQEATSMAPQRVFGTRARGAAVVVCTEHQHHQNPGPGGRDFKQHQNQFQVLKPGSLPCYYRTESYRSSP